MIPSSRGDQAITIVASRADPAVVWTGTVLLYRNKLERAKAAFDEAWGRRLRVEPPRLGHGLGVLSAEAAEVFLAHLRAPKPETVPALLGIAERAESVPYVFHAARLRRFAAKIMLAMGDKAGAEREYRFAHETFQRPGAEFEPRLTREQMREQGWRPPQKLNGARGVLTPRELEITTFAARGQSNKEIGAALDISWRTVSRHLATIYTKLAVDSRLGLAEAVKRRADGLWPRSDLTTPRSLLPLSA